MWPWPALQSKKSKPTARTWAGNSRGFRHTTAISTTISTSRSRPSSSRRETRSTISARGNPGWKIFPATAFSSKTTQAKSFTPIQHLAAAASNFSALTAILTSRRKVAMRTARTIRWAIGCAPEICTVRAARSKAMEDFTRQGAARVRRLAGDLGVLRADSISSFEPPRIKRKSRSKRRNFGTHALFDRSVA
jgi:hypothetical protein